MKIVAHRDTRARLLDNLLNEYKLQVGWLGTMIAHAGFGVVLVTRAGQIVYANRIAESQMRLRRGLCCQHGRIVATDVNATHKLQALITAASLPINQTLSGGSMILSDQDRDAFLTVHVVPLSRTIANQLDPGEWLVVGLFVIDQNRDTAGRVNVFASLFDLTPAETRLLAALISGKGLTSTAKRLEITELTARSHLKHILAKTDTHRQTELMRLFFEVTIPFEESLPSSVRLGQVVQ